MAKMTETQRGYFINRVNGKISKEVNAIKLKNSVKIADATEKGYKRNLNDVGVYHLMKRLLKLEKDQKALGEKLSNVIKGIDSNAYIGFKNNHETLSKWFKDKARIVVDGQFSKTKEGSRIAELEKLREEAVDYLYGLSNNNEIAIGLNKILNPSGVKFLEGGE